MSDMTITEEDIDLAILAVKENFKRALAKHGAEVYDHKHKILGDITEEYDELLDAIREDYLPNIKAELLDIAVGAIWSVVSIDKGVVKL